MSKFNEGDRVRLTKGDTVINTMLSLAERHLGYVYAIDRTVDAWEQLGYTIELIKAAPKPLPTEGWWYDKNLGISEVYHFEMDEDAPAVSIYLLDGKVSDGQLEDWAIGTEEWVRIDDENA